MSVKDDTGDRNGHNIDVLLVEDNPGDVRLVQEAFDAVDRETRLRVATDGVEALEMLSRRRDSNTESLPDLVLLDLNLPRMDGNEVLEAIRHDPAISHLPVLILSSSAASDDVRRSYEGFANAYLTKPIDPEEFVTLIQSIETFWGDLVRLPPQ